MFKRLMICYLPAADLRRIDPGICPHIATLLSDCPSVRFRAQPSTDQLATILSGTWPHEHGMWGPRLRPDWRQRRPVQRLIDQLPDLLTVTGQGVRHLINGPLDLATMPPRRRRRFDWLRFNVKFARDVARMTRTVNGLPSVFTVAGAAPSRFVYHDDRWNLERLLAGVGNGDHRLEMVDCHCLDHSQHWNMADEAFVRDTYRLVDAFVAALHAKCRAQGIGFVLFSDHGTEPVSRVIDLPAELARLDLPPDSFDVFIEYSKATFWFHEPIAERRISEALGSRSDGRLLAFPELRRYQLHFTDNGYGDAYFYPEPGATLYPNDFQHPLANMITALRDRQQRRRLSIPWHQAEHGYLSEADSERGFMVLADDGWEAAAEDEVALIDLAPTWLRLLGLEPAATMRGRPVFLPRSRRSATAAS